jgi:4-hydroxythreonine-4-phosphate dehydrogenase
MTSPQPTPAPPPANATPRLAISMGDPLGIGPEIIVKALLDEPTRRLAAFDIYADIQPLDLAASRLDPERARAWLALRTTDAIDPARPPAPGLVRVITPSPTPSPARAAPNHATASGSPKVDATAPGPTARAGQRSFDAVLAAVDALKTPDPARRADALVTAPIAKESWHLAGITYPGHTELLADRFASPRSAMLFVGPALRVILATIHVALRDVPALLTIDRLVDTITLGHEACLQLGLPAPRIAVAGLNPHAGESRLFGHEDADLIAPAVHAARARAIDVVGPLPGDTVFLAAAKGRFDLVVAMYHDQGLIPVKLLDRERAVNVTVGLSHNHRLIIRTSPAHGTAFDIASTNHADPASMIHAIALATQMVRARDASGDSLPRAPRA